MTAERRLHLAIIPDGNRRWAKEQALKPWEGHERGMKVFRTLLTWLYDRPEIGVVTVWGFSTENWNRGETEIQYLMRFYEEWLESERKSFAERGVRFVRSGRVDRIPESLAALCDAVEKETAANDTVTLNFALDYGGKDEMIRAVRKLSNPAEVSEETIRDNLDHPDLPDIDLIIRTSGEKRVSNFFLWQGAYAELFFIDNYFPDLTTDQLGEVLDEFSARERRFGK